MTTQAVSLVFSVDNATGLNLWRDTHCQWPVFFVVFLNPYKLMLYDHSLPRPFQFMNVQSFWPYQEIARTSWNELYKNNTTGICLCFRSYEMPRSWPCAWTIVARAHVTMILGMAPECWPQYHIRSMPRNLGKWEACGCPAEPRYGLDVLSILVRFISVPTLPGRLWLPFRRFIQLVLSLGLMRRVREADH